LQETSSVFARNSEVPDNLSSISSVQPSSAQRPQGVVDTPDLELSDEAQIASHAQLRLPLLGTHTIAWHQRTLAILLALAIASLLGIAWYGYSVSEKVDRQLYFVGQSLMQSQRLGNAISQALTGRAEAFPVLSESASALQVATDSLLNGNKQLDVATVSDDLQADVVKISQFANRARKSADTVLSQQKILTQANTALRNINRQSADLLEIAETVSSLKLQQGASPAEISAAGQLVMLTQRIGKSANEFLTMEGVSPEAVFLLGKDLNSFKDIAQGLSQGSAELRLLPTKDPRTRESLDALMVVYERTRQQASAILGNLQGLVAAREAQAVMASDTEPMRRGLEEMQAIMMPRAQLSLGVLSGLVICAALALLLSIGIAYVQVQEGKVRQLRAEAQRSQAEHQEQDAKRVNDANQAAILRLMNELQVVAEGDLTQEATVTEDITGAIADSVNYTVEELRSLVSSVQTTASQVARTTSLVENTSTELLTASTQQLREIRETGQSVLDMAERINQVSHQAQESASVAHQSLSAAESGLQAVQNAIGGMNSIRDQIQETSKRIKRLGESSQEIGEITELISDITEQTNVLALNAAIQAASAGEAGRGFSVVAEEVQRLAERSADATRQIALLVKTIQADTQDAVAAMERSTQGVVMGAKLSDGAGTALSEIDRVSRRLAELIEQISKASSQEASSANVVAEKIQHIFAVTEQTGEGTRSTAAQIRELSVMAEELRKSVSRFKIS